MALSTSSLLILGGGGHGKVVADLARALGHVVVGYVDADPTKKGQIVEPGGARVIFDEAEFLAALEADKGYPPPAEAIALGVGDNRARERCLLAIGELPAPYLIHPSAVVSPSASFGRGTVAFPRVVMNAAAVIGDAVILNTGCIVEHDCVVGRAAHISPSAVLAGNVRIGARAWVGAGAVVVPGITIGDDAIVGAGAVVIRDVAAGATVVGNPARVVEKKLDPSAAEATDALKGWSSQEDEETYYGL